jgi:hypothetical protein
MVAQRLRRGEGRLFGLLPAASDVAVPPIAVRLAIALAAVSGEPAAFVDANLYWPATKRDEASGEPATRWLGDSVAIVSGERVGEVAALLPRVEALLAEAQRDFGHAVIDLTGLDALGLLSAVLHGLDGAVVVARAGHTREGDLLSAAARLPAQRQRGVLLVG